MNTVNMARLSRCEIFSTSPLDGKALDSARTPGIELKAALKRCKLLIPSTGRMPEQRKIAEATYKPGTLQSCFSPSHQLSHTMSAFQSL